MWAAAICQEAGTLSGVLYESEQLKVESVACVLSMRFKQYATSVHAKYRHSVAKCSVEAVKEQVD